MLSQFRRHDTAEFSAEQKCCFEKLTQITHLGIHASANLLEDAKRAVIRTARVIVSTCIASADPTLSHYKPEIVITDGSNHMSEWAGVLPAAVFASSFVNRSLLGDSKQLLPQVSGKDRGAFYNQSLYPLMERLKDTGILTR